MEHRTAAAQQQCKARLYGLYGLGRRTMGHARPRYPVDRHCRVGAARRLFSRAGLARCHPPVQACNCASPASRRCRPCAASATGPAMGMADVIAVAGYRFRSPGRPGRPRAPSPAFEEMRRRRPRLGQSLNRWRRWPFRATPMPQSGSYRFSPSGGSGTRIAVFCQGPAGLPVDTQGVQDDTEVWRTFVEGLRVTPLIICAHGRTAG